MTPRHSHLWCLALALGLGLLFWPALPAGHNALAQGVTQGATGGYYYVVQLGDTWTEIAARNGLTYAQLQAANPTLLRPGDVLWPGDRLFIPGATPSPGTLVGGYWYTVQPGDTWQIVAKANGMSVLDLWHANPGQLVQRRWLYIGTRLWIPAHLSAEPSAAPAGQSATAATPIPAPQQLSSTGPATAVTTTLEPTESITATPEAATAITLPVTAAAPAATLPVTSTAVTAAAPEATLPATSTVVTMAAPEATLSISAATPAVAAVPAGAGPAPTASTGAASTGPASCPSQQDGYSAAISAFLNAPGATVAGLRTWLVGCGALRIDAGSVTVAGIQNPASSDVVVAIAPQAHATGPDQEGRVLVYHQTPSGYVLAGIGKGLGQVTVLRVGDINDDGKTDIVWTDTVCPGPATCVSTLFVDSWDGSAYRSWLQDQPTLAEAQFSFGSVPEGQGLAILAQGTITGTDGTTTTVTQTYISPAGGLYRLLSPAAAQPVPAASATPVTLAAAQSGPAASATPVTPAVSAAPAASAPAPSATPAASSCLYQHILDADQAFDGWTVTGFGPAIAAYQSAITDQSLTACANIPNELTVLRDFARFRLMLASLANGSTDDLASLHDQITTPALQGAASAFLSSYQGSQSIVQACRDTTDYASAHPDAWQWLANAGSASASFSASDLCPLGK
jgi:LysM repeat protein